MVLKLKRTPGIYLVGFMGCGKTTVGRMLAQEMGWPFADLDHDIEVAEKRSVPDLFASAGEEAFREMEAKALQKRVAAVRAGRPLVLALGGGAFVPEANRDLVVNNGLSIWLDCTFEVVKSRLEHCQHRPLARDPRRMAELYEQRRAAYAQADYRIEVVRDDSQSAFRAILTLPIF